MSVSLCMCCVEAAMKMYPVARGNMSKTVGEGKFKGRIEVRRQTSPNWLSL